MARLLTHLQLHANHVNQIPAQYVEGIDMIHSKLPVRQRKKQRTRRRCEALCILGHIPTTQAKRLLHPVRSRFQPRPIPTPCPSPGYLSPLQTENSQRPYSPSPAPSAPPLFKPMEIAIFLGAPPPSLPELMFLLPLRSMWLCVLVVLALLLTDELRRFGPCVVIFASSSSSSSSRRRFSDNLSGGVGVGVVGCGVWSRDTGLVVGDSWFCV